MKLRDYLTSTLLKEITWAQHAKEDKEFRLGRQWTAEQIETLKSRGQAPIVINRDSSCS